MFSDHDETSPSIAAVSALLVACSMLAVQQQKVVNFSEEKKCIRVTWLEDVLTSK